MKISLPHLIVGLGWFCVSAQFIGCIPLGGTGTIPNRYPGQPVGGYNPYPYPRVPVGPGFPGGPGVPVVLNPSPGTNPIPPIVLPSNPGTLPTVPVGLPGNNPTIPAADSTKFWSPWPLPPRGKQMTAKAAGAEGTVADYVANRPNAGAGRLQDAAGADSESYVRQTFNDDSNSTASEDLKYRGGRTIRDLSYVNLYIGGDTNWTAADVERIDGSLSGAMRDEHLNNVLLQYFGNQAISSTALPSHPLVGYTPKVVTQGDIQNYAAYLHQQGFLKTYDLQNTVFNFLLPSGTVLTTDVSPVNGLSASGNSQSFEPLDTSSTNEQVDSTQGLGGYHGSVETASGVRIYYTAGTYSQRFANGATNGIPVFTDPWKNVVATLYHQLIESRTDPNVEDANRRSSDLNADRNLGWVSDSGQEIGDIALRANTSISNIIREVPLANGSGTVPIQLPYSNFAHGPEGPLSQPHPLP